MAKSNYIIWCLGLFLFVNVQTFSQGWVGNSGNNLNAVNSSLTPTPINIGIGTNLPTAQLHTNGTLRHENLTNANLLTQILVTDPSGNVFWRDASTFGTSNTWLINGNNNIVDGTNFIGTTNNQSVIFKVNNKRRFSISKEFTPVGFTRNVSPVEVGVSSDTTNLTNFFVWSRDVVGLSLPVFINSDISGMIFSNNSGNNNTLGRLIRLNQGNTNSDGGNNFYDIGISNTQSLFITPRLIPKNIGFPMKMFTISTADRVGFRLAWGEEPTADFHTVGSVRHENLPGGKGSLLVIDAAGNIFRDNSFFVQNKVLDKEIENLKKELEILKKMIYRQDIGLKKTEQAILYQNIPNPFNVNTEIKFYLPKEVKSATIQITDVSGRSIKEIPIPSNGKGSVIVQKGILSAGTYIYSLLIDHEVIESKKMVLLR